MNEQEKLAAVLGPIFGAMLEEMEQCDCPECQAEQQEPEVAERPHADLMMEYAANPNALVYVKIGEVGEDTFWVYVTTPEWNADEEYHLVDHLTPEQAIEDSRETWKQFKEEVEAYNTQVNDAMNDVHNLYVKTMSQLHNEFIDLPDLGDSFAE